MNLRLPMDNDHEPFQKRFPVGSFVMIKEKLKNIKSFNNIQLQQLNIEIDKNYTIHQCSPMNFFLRWGSHCAAQAGWHQRILIEPTQIHNSAVY